MQIINITNPREPRKVATFDCKISQGDIQVWKRDGRVLASYTADGTVGEEGAASTCGRDLDLSADDAGTVLVDLTIPSKPSSLGFLDVPRGSHNMTIHPSGRYLYNSNSDLLTSTEPSITIYDVSRPTRPEKVRDYRIPFVPTSLGSESHDITFNAAGTRAYSGALSQTLILDTTDPRRPKQVTQIVDPAINVVHQADPVTLTRKNGTKRKILVVTDERAGAAASAECPGGGLHLFDITGAKESNPEKIGTWFIPTVQPQDGSHLHLPRAADLPEAEADDDRLVQPGRPRPRHLRARPLPGNAGLGRHRRRRRHEGGRPLRDARLRHLVVQDQQDPP